MKHHPTEKESSWLAPPDSKTGDKSDLRQGLYLVATPIGNLRDISFRALDVLSRADEVFCEDTRVSGKLLNHYGIRTKLKVYNDHSGEDERAAILGSLARGGVIALVSDAGSPVVSDPGYKLVRACRDLGIMVTAVPGASAPLAAVQLSGLPCDKFSFLGFLPPKSGARRTLLEDWKTAPGALVCFETAPRLKASLKDMREMLGNRPAAVVRELTKLHEEVRAARLGDLLDHYTERGAPKGEIVIVVGPPEERQFTDAELESCLREALRTMPVKEAAALVAGQTGLPRSPLYDMALKIRGSK